MAMSGLPALLCHSGASRSGEPGTHDWAKPILSPINHVHPVVGSGFGPSGRPGMTEGDTQCP